MQNLKHTQKEMASPSEVALQKEGFSFSFAASACALCGGRCCVGESGYIFLSLAEAQRIAEFLNIAFEDFALKFLKKVGYKFSLIEKPYENGSACVFFDTKKRECAIYPYRPKQCVEFPFWDSLREQSALAELCSLCPGIIPPESTKPSQNLKHNATKEYL